MLPEMPVSNTLLVMVFGNSSDNYPSITLSTGARRRSLSNLFPLSQRQTTRTHAFSRIVAEGERFELSVGFPTHAFQACALDHYANPPSSLVIARQVYTRIPTSAFTLSSTGGCVENILAMKRPASWAPKGFEIKRCAVAWFARRIGAWY